MAPVGMVGMMGWISAPEVGIISLVVFLVLSVTLLALCVRCQKKPTNAYDVNGTTTDGAGGTNGIGMSTNPAFSQWRGHENMPESTLGHKPKAYTT